MKCLACGKWGLHLLCSHCQEQIILKPSVRLVGDLKVYSFFAFSEVQALLHFKYTFVGPTIYSILANKARVYFSKHFSLKAYGVGIDDQVSKGYSHNGVFLHAFKECGITPLYGALLAKTHIKYAGKSLEYRQSHPKGFYTSLQGISPLILFDDIITTGTSLLEAKKVLEERENEILFALTLCDAKE